jgi:hypothetical protein
MRARTLIWQVSGGSLMGELEPWSDPGEETFGRWYILVNVMGFGTAGLE